MNYQTKVKTGQDGQFVLTVTREADGKSANFTGYDRRALMAFAASIEAEGMGNPPNGVSLVKPRTKLQKQSRVFWWLVGGTVATVVAGFVAVGVATYDPEAAHHAAQQYQAENMVKELGYAKAYREECGFEYTDEYHRLYARYWSPATAEAYGNAFIYMRDEWGVKCELAPLPDHEGWFECGVNCPAIKRGD